MTHSTDCQSRATEVRVKDTTTKMNAVLLVSMLFLTSVFAQRAPTWDSCSCSWNQWEEWSICDKLCYGRQRRQRSVQVLDTPSCGTFESCDGGNGAFDHRNCNTACTYGNYDSSTKMCACPAGRYGVCCTNVITCGPPSDPSNGGHTVSDGFNYGSVVTYTCNERYNMTGANTATCTSQFWSFVGYWSNSVPRCHYVESCKSSPCENGGTCVDGLDVYTCMCGPGWTGEHCQTDIQPPVATNCSENSTLYTAKSQLDHEWTVPSFSDPLGNDVTTTSNYGSNSYVFPWGDFIVQYVATKPSNGLQTKCEFQLQIRPHPCEEFPAPKNGYVVCNGWKADFGRFCLIGCLHNYTLPRDLDERQWFVCGSSGRWTPAVTTFECEGQIPGSTDGDVNKPLNCGDDRMVDVKEKYITQLKLSSFNSFCLDTPKICNENNVNVDCS